MIVTPLFLANLLVYRVSSLCKKGNIYLFIEVNSPAIRKTENCVFASLFKETNQINTL